MAEFSEELPVEIKKELLGLGEDAAKVTVERLFNIIELAIKDSKNKFDDMLLPALPKLKDVTLTYVDKISDIPVK
jgi:hypothetical protein